MVRSLRRLVGSLALGLLPLFGFAQGEAQPSPANAPQGGSAVVTGTVFDGELAEPVLGATVVLAPTANPTDRTGALTDFDGNYVFRNVTPGTYVLTLFMIGYDTVRVNDFQVAPGVNRQDFELTIEGMKQDVVEIEAKAIRNTENALLAAQLKSSKTLDAIAADLMNRLSDNNAAGALARVTGVSVVGGKYVYVRGLGDRYSLTTLNGNVLPGLDPDQNTVQMDLFPAALIDNITVYKNVSADLPGSYAGGLVDIVTKDFPEAKTLTFSLGLGYNTNATFNDNYLSYKGGATDFLGIDDGTRQLPQLVRERNVPEVNGNAALWPLQDSITRSFSSTMAPEARPAFLNHNFSIGYGDATTLKGRPLGYYVGLSYRRSFTHYEDGFLGRYQLSGNVANQELLDDRRRFIDDYSGDNVVWSAQALASWRLTNRDQLSVNFLHSQNGQKGARYMIGNRFGDDNSGDFLFENRVLEYWQRSLSALQLRGEHRLNDRELDLTWRGVYTLSLSNEPDLRMLTNDLTWNAQGDTFYDIKPSLYQIPSRYFRTLTQHNADLRADLEQPFGFMGRTAKWKTGLATRYTTRAFTEDLYQYQENLPYSYQGDANAWLADSNIGIRQDGTPGPLIVVNSRPSNNYTGFQLVGAGYGQVELPLASRLRFIAGLRVEYTYLFAQSANNAIRPGELSNLDPLPSASLLYKVREAMNVRFTYGRTLARPTFREIVPYENFAFIGDYAIQGEADLNRTLVDNVDLRWEWFPNPGEILSVSAFFKYLQDPIVLAFNTTSSDESDLRFIYQNEAWAYVYGFELDARKNLGFITPALKNFRIGANASLIFSEMTIPSFELEVRRLTNPDAASTRQLFNQSPYLINSYLTYDSEKLGLAITGSINVFGERLSIVSFGGAPDIFERPRPMLNFSVTKELPKGWSVSASAQNLLDPDYAFTQTFKGVTYDFQRYNIGRTFSISVRYAPSLL